MVCLKTSLTLSRDELLALVASLLEEVARLEYHLAEAEATIVELRKENAELKRGAKRQAAPFSKGTHVEQPRRPGRKPSEGPFSYRKAPRPEEVTEPPVAVSVTVATCPACGGRLRHERVEVAYTTDLPPVPRPRVTEYRVEVCRCLSCGKQVRGQHPEVAPDQYGASAHRLGGRAMAAAHALHYGVGIPVRKVPAVLQLLTGVEVTQGAVTQDALRRAHGAVGSVYEGLRGSVRKSPLVHTDDTGWRVAGQTAFLMTFETTEATVYQVKPKHRNEEVREVIPADYAGVLVTDRARTYDAQELAPVRQQKCLAHVLRSISDVVESKTGRARSFGTHLKGLLRESMDLWRASPRAEQAGRAAEAERLRQAITHHLRGRRLTDPDNQRLLDELGWHHDRGNLLRFLEEPRIEPTNNRAERALRPAVIARKVSHCSKNWQGAYAFSAFSSVLRTLTRQRDQSPVEGLYQVFRRAHPQLAPQ